MSKREMGGPHANRSHGIDFNMSSTPDDKPQRATAAQLANRRIKQLGTRRPRPPGSTVQQPLPSGPFNAIDPNTVASSSGSAPSFDQFNPAGPSLLASSSASAPSNGFAFGQSQSFPGAGSNSTRNESQPPTFGAGVSSSFNFSNSSTSSGFNNPFSNLNGGPSQTSAQNQPAAASGGFKGSLFNIPGVPAPNLAQSTQIVSQASQGSGSGLFATTSAGAPTSGASIFQSAPSTTSATPFLFGKSAPQTTTTNLFGTETSNKPFVFGQSTASATSSETPKDQNLLSASIGSDSMQTSPDGKTKTPTSGALSPTTNNPFTSQPSTPLFGPSVPSTQSASTAASSNSLFGRVTKPSESQEPPAASTAPASSTMAAGNSLFDRVTKPGESQAPDTPTTRASSTMAAGNSVFGQVTKPGESQAADTSTTPDSSTMAAGNSLFGRVSKPGESPAALATQASSTIPASSTMAAGNSLFGQMTKPGESQAPDTSITPASSTMTAGNSVFDRVTKPSGPHEAPNASPSDDQSGKSTNEQSARAGTSAGEGKPVFDFGGTQTSTSKSISSSSSVASNPKFGQTNLLTAPSASFKFSSGATFGQSSKTADTPATPRFGQSSKASDMTTTGTPFGQTPKVQDSLTNQTSTQGNSNSLLARVTKPSTSNDTKSATSASSTSFSPSDSILGQTPKPAGASQAQTLPTSAPEPQHSAPAQPLNTLFASSSKSTESLRQQTPSNASPQKSNALKSPTKLPATSFADKKPSGMPFMKVPEAPADLDDEQKSDFKKRWMLRMLNESFQRKINETKTDSDGYDSLIMFYLNVREAIDIPLGSMVSKPGKRKERDEDHNKAAKKVKASDFFTEERQSSAASPAKFLSSSSSTSNPSVLPPSAEPSTSSTNTSNKRKASEDTDSVNDSNAQSGKRAKNSPEPQSSTASIFANSFSASNGPGVAGSPTKRSSSSSLGMKAPRVPSFMVNAKPIASQSDVDGLSSSSTPQTTKSPAKPAFQLPKFGSNNGTNFLAQFGKQAAVEAEKQKAKRKADDFDSDEDDEAEWERKDAEAQEKKKQKARHEHDQLRTRYVAGKGFAIADSAEKAKADEPATPAQPAASLPDQATPAPSVFENQRGALPTTSDNLFGHLSSTNPSDEGESSDDDDFVTAHRKSILRQAQEAEAAQKKEKQGEEPQSNGRSLSDRIQFGSDGKPLRDSSASDDDNASKAAKTPNQPAPSLFHQSTPMSSLSVPNNTPSSTFMSTPSTSFGQSITFGAPNLPSSHSKSQLFGQTSTLQPFGAHLTSFSNPGTASPSLASGSDANADDTDGESNDPQVDLMGNTGEEGEDLILMTRSRALKLNKESGWETKGLGALRVLVNKTEGRARVILRAEPSGNVVLNAAIHKSIEYTVSNTSVQFAVPLPNGSGVELWALRVKTKDAAAELGHAMNTAKDFVKA